MITGLCAAQCVALPSSAASIKHGTVPKNRIANVMPYLGDYEGRWDSAVADAVTDGISRYQLDNPVLRLSLDAGNKLRVRLFMDRASAQQNDELDLLGFGCRSQVGDLLELDVPKKTPKPPSQESAEPYPVFTARFDFDWGNCPSRVYAVPSNDLEFTLLVDPAQQQYVAQLRLLKRVQGDDKIVIEENGAQRVVKVRRKVNDPASPGQDGSLYAPAMEYCVLNEFGEVEQCFDRESELKRYIVPFPFPGLSALWWTKRSPSLKVVKGVKYTYHEAVFRRAFDAKVAPQ